MKFDVRKTGYDEYEVRLTPKVRYRIENVVVWTTYFGVGFAALYAYAVYKSKK